MSRIARKNIVSKVIHIVTKGINREFIFYKNEYKEKYISLVNIAIKELADINLIAYCIMDNHAHFLIYAEQINKVEKLMRKVNTSYAIFYNFHEEREGYVFSSRYHSQLIENEIHLLACINYIHNNPVKAGLTDRMEKYKYSSYQLFFCRKKNFKILSSLLGDDWKNLFCNSKNIEDYNFIDEELRDIKDDRRKIEQIISEFCDENKTSIAQIKRSNDLIIKLKKYLNKRHRVSNKSICTILGIGKNRISWIEKRAKKTIKY